MNRRELFDKFDDLSKLIHESFKITEKEPLEISEIHDEVKDIYKIAFFMLNRVQEQTDTTVKLFLNGEWASFEALCRIAMEYSMRLAYILHKEQKERFSQYFSCYFAEMERIQNLSVNEKIKINFKESENNLEIRKSIMIEYCRRHGLDITKEYIKINFRDMCIDLNCNDIYRTFYSNLSSIVHADADALIDFIIIECIQWPDTKKQNAYKEFYEWMVNELIAVLNIYITTYEMYYKLFLKNSKKPLELIKKIRTCLNKHLSELSLNNKK